MHFPFPAGHGGVNTDLEDLDVQTEDATANLCLFAKDTTSDGGGGARNAFRLEEVAGTFNLAQGASASAVPLTVLSDNSNTVTTGTHTIVGGVGVVAGTCQLPSGGIFVP